MKNRRSHRAAVRSAILFALVAQHSGCSQNENLKPEFDFSRQSPMEFLEYLRDEVGPDRCYFFSGPKEDWIHREHLPGLMKVLDSQEPCAGVAMYASSSLAVRSTVGNEAAFLIEGYRLNRYPPDLHSGRLAADVRESIRRWWATELERSAMPPVKAAGE